jgi:C4-dicarboxylate-specific signal transduction histidine kinase
MTMNPSGNRPVDALAALRPEWLGVASAVPVLAASFGLVAAIATLDHMTGYELRLAILYLVPIGFATWKLGAIAGTFVTAAATLSWILAFGTSHPYSHPFYFYWEGSLTGVSFLVIVVLLARLRQALARSDERFVTVLEGLEAAVDVEDARAHTVLYANRHFRESFGTAPPPFRDAGEIWDEQTQRWYLLQSQPLRWIDGRAALLRVLSDVTDSRRARELIERHREAAHRTSRLVALGEFASAIAHELNQPLAAIATYNNTCLRLLQSGAADATEVREAMQKSRDQAKRAGAIIQRLREILRQPAPAFVEQDLNDVAKAAVQLAQPEALESGVSLELGARAQGARVRVDRLLMEQVALNLLRNAIEAVESLSPERRRVTVETAVDSEGRATLAVSDLGEGVPAEVREKLFDAFVTNKPGGLGLGLSICRSVIEAHGGTIRYEQNGARGARFAFTIPGLGP